MKLFNAADYFEKICKSNKLLVDNGFVFTRIGNNSLMTEVFEQMHRHPAILALSDVTNGNISMGGAGTYYRLRVFTIYLFMRCTPGDMNNYYKNLDTCRMAMQSVFSKLIVDSHELASQLVMLDTKRMPFNEFDGYLLNGHSGVSFMFTSQEPVNLCYNKDEWL